MKNHIASQIEKILFSGGFVSLKLEKLIDKLSEVSHPNSLERKFSEAITEIESRKGQIHPNSKDAILKAIDKVWASYPKGEKELYRTGTTTQIENGVKITKTLI